MGREAETVRKRAGVILLGPDESVALIERRRAGLLYYVFPGGGLDASETWEEAARRECWEELGLLVRVGRLVARVQFGVESDQRYFLAVAEGGVFGTGTGEEMASASDSMAGSYRPIWVPLREISQYDVRPRDLAGVLGRGLPEIPLDIVEPVAKSR